MPLGRGTVGREHRQAGKQASRQAGRQAGRQAAILDLLSFGVDGTSVRRACAQPAQQNTVQRQRPAEGALPPGRGKVGRKVGRKRKAAQQGAAERTRDKAKQNADASETQEGFTTRDAEGIARQRVQKANS